MRRRDSVAILIFLDSYLQQYGRFYIQLSELISCNPYFLRFVSATRTEDSRPQPSLNVAILIFLDSYLQQGWIFHILMFFAGILPVFWGVFGELKFCTLVYKDSPAVNKGCAGQGAQTVGTSPFPSGYLSGAPLLQPVRGSCL